MNSLFEHAPLKENVEGLEVLDSHSYGNQMEQSDEPQARSKSQYK